MASQITHTTPVSRVAVGDAVLPADPVEEHLDRLRAEAAGEDLAVVGEDLVRDPVTVQRLGQDRADGLGGRPPDQAGSDAEPAVIIHARDDLQLARIIEEHPSHHVHLPQLHRTLTLPATELIATLASASEFDESVALQAAVDRRA
jgi:hypothetical protein